MYRLLSITELSRVTAVPHPTLRNWVLRGWLEPFAQTKGGVCYFTDDAIAEVKRLRARPHRYRKGNES